MLVKQAGETASFSYLEVPILRQLNLRQPYWSYSLMGNAESELVSFPETVCVPVGNRTEACQEPGGQRWRAPLLLGVKGGRAQFAQPLWLLCPSSGL